MSTQEREVIRYLRGESDPGQRFDASRYLHEEPPDENAVRGYLSGGPGKLESFGRGVAQGATLGFADEIAAGVRSLGDGTFAEEVERSRARDEAARQAHGKLMFAGEMAGSLAPAVAGGAGAVAARGGAAGARSVGARLLASNAAMGAVEGAGRAEGDVLERLPEAGVGGVVGGLAGAALPLAGRGVRRVAEAAGLRGGARRRAADEILEALQRADMEPADLPSRVSGAPDETIMDIVPPARDLAEIANLYPSSARNEMEGFLEGRVREQYPRAQTALEAGTGLQREGSGRIARQLLEERRTNAQRLFPQAYAQGPVQMTPELAEVLSKPSAQRAYMQALEIAGETGEMLAPLAAPDVRTLHFVKMGLDDVVAKGKAPGEGGLGPSLTFHYDQNRRRLLDEIRRVAPGLSDALDEYAGDTAMVEALELGRTRFHLDPPDEVADLLSTMTSGEIEMFRRGAVDNVLHRLGNPAERNNLLTRFMQSPNDQARMSLLFDDPAEFEAFARQMHGLAEQGYTRNEVLRGSQTAERLTGRERLEGRGMGTSLMSLLNELGSERRMASGARTAEALTPLLTETDLPGLAELLEGRVSDRARRELAGSAATRLGTLSAAPALLSLLYPNEEGR